MPTGSINVQLTDVRGEAIAGRIDLTFTPVGGDAGAGGAAATAFSSGGVTELVVSNLECRGGPGTLYRVRASATDYRPYAFFQLVRENTVTTASDDVELWVKPKRVTSIRAPAYQDLPPAARHVLEHAAMVKEKKEDEDLVGLKGASLYGAMGPLRQACFLNVITKASHAATTGNIVDALDQLLVCRQDRLFVTVKPELARRIRESELYKSARDALHPPLPGYVRSAEGSFKSHDAHANIQVTFQQHASGQHMAADIDIDEASGIEHGFEVIGNAVLNKRTNPYLIREFMAVADRAHRSLVPPYAFVF